MPPMISKYLISFLRCATIPLVLYSTLAPTSAIPQAAAIGGLIAKGFLDKAEVSANKLMDKARETGDHLIFAFAQNLLFLIAEAKKNAGELITETIDKVGNERNRLFFQIEGLLKDAENNLDKAYEEADQLSANLAQTIQNIPGFSKTAQIYSVRPPVLPPLDVDTIVMLAGPNMGKAKAVVTLPDNTKIPLTSYKEAASYFKIKPLQFATKPNEAHFIEVRIDYIKESASWWSLFGKDEMVTRIIPLVVPAKVPGKVHLIQTTSTTQAERTTYNLPLWRGGKNNNHRVDVGIPPEYVAKNFRIDTEAVRLSIDGTARNRLLAAGVPTPGEKGHCSGPDVQTNGAITNSSFVYLIWTGEIDKGVGRSNDPGWQSCTIAVPLIRDVPVTIISETEWQELSWAAPTTLTPNINATTVVVEYEYQNGARRQFAPTEAVLPINLTRDASGTIRITPKLSR